MFFRRPLMVLLSLGVIFGYGGAFAAMHHHRMGCHGEGRAAFGHSWERDERPFERTQAPAPQQPQTVVVQSPAPAPAAAPQVFVIMPGATTQGVPQVVTQPAAATNVAPTQNAP